MAAGRRWFFEIATPRARRDPHEGMVATALDHVVTMIFLEAETKPLWTIPVYSVPVPGIDMEGHKGIGPLDR